MRLSYRVASATLLLLLAFFLVKYHLDSLRNGSLRPFWKPAKAQRPPDVYTHIKTKLNLPESSLLLKSQLSLETTEIVVPNDRILVMAKLAAEDTNWVGTDLAEWKYKIYTVDDTNAPTHTPKNKGRESLAYLQYIVDHYNDLPSTIVFLHPHRDGPLAWHADNEALSNLDSVRNLKLDFVQKNGYANLRCQHNLGCLTGIKPYRNPPSRMTVEKEYKAAYAELFNSTDVPREVAVPCCSQFAVSRDQVLKRPLSDYQWFYNWVLETDLPDNLTSSVMENTWHIIFGQDAVYCPTESKCYEDVYGVAASDLSF